MVEFTYQPLGCTRYGHGMYKGGRRMTAWNTGQFWGSVTKALHWSIAIKVIGNIVIAK
jgi:hypothetical protein